MNITDYFPDYKEVGYVKKSYGVNGHLRAFIQEEYNTTFETVKHCFFLLKGCLVPYFIADYKEGVIKFESVSNPEDTKVLASRTIYLRDDQILESATKPMSKLDFGILEGYTAIDAETEVEVGKISEVVAYPEQEIASVIKGEKQFLIPLNIHNVKAIDQENQEVYLDIPLGLLDL